MSRRSERLEWLLSLEGLLRKMESKSLANLSDEALDDAGACVHQARERGVVTDQVGKQSSPLPGRKVPVRCVSGSELEQPGCDEIDGQEILISVGSAIETNISVVTDIDVASEPWDHRAGLGEYVEQS